jgi:hypothetical protein
MVVKVCYELDNIKFFDDVAVVYDEPFTDLTGYRVGIDYYQVKFHVTEEKAFTWRSLIDPIFINAKTSILQRLKEAKEKYTQNKEGARFHLVAPCGIDPNDGLAQLISKVDGELRLDNLSKDGPKSCNGEIRREWCRHLGIEDTDELLNILKPLRIKSNSPDMSDIISRLNEGLALSGLKPIETGDIKKSYIGLIQELRRLGQTAFTQSDIIGICKDQKLWVGKPLLPSKAINIGIRSLKWKFESEDREKITGENNLRLLDYFDGRPLKDTYRWADIFRLIAEFLRDGVSMEQEYLIHFCAHSTIALIAGYCLDIKFGKKVYPIQRILDDCKIWKPDNESNIEEYPKWEVNEQIISNGDNRDIALAISITHSVTKDVCTYIEKTGLPIKKILEFKVGGSPSVSSIRNADHAWQLARTLSSELWERRSIDERSGALHIFYAGPVALLFFIGRIARGLGQFTFYEYGFERQIPGDYLPSISLP